MTFRWNSNVSAIKAHVRKAAERGLDKALEHNLQVSNTRVPIEEGTLERSGNTSRDGLKGAVSYDTPYAARQHEELGYTHDGGRTAKYLEKTLNGERRKSAELIADEIRRGNGG